MRAGPIALGLLLALPPARALAAASGGQVQRQAPAPGRAQAPGEEGPSDNSKPIISAPAREYSRKQLGVEGFFTNGAAEKGSDPLYWQVYEGRGRNLIDPAVFYTKVGREDLAASYRRWTTLKPLLVLGGLGSMVGALFALKVRPAAYALAGGGLTMFIVGYAADPQPVGWKEALTLADAHNDALANRLGLRSVTIEGDGSKDPDVSAAALAAYEQSYVDFDIHMTFENGAPDRSSRRWVPFQGKDKRTLDHPAFYRLMGREDLAAAYKRNQGVQIGLLVGGLGLGITGVVVLYEGGKSGDHTMAYAGLGIMVGGVVSFMIARYYDVDPISEAEARELADEYNRSVLRRAGVPIADADGDDQAADRAASPAPRPAPPAPPKTWGFAFPAVGGGGLGLAGTF